MAKRPKDPRSFIKPPGYEGGKKALDQFIKKNLKYPKEASEKRVEGIVKVDFDLNHKGKVVKATAKTDFGCGLEEEAVRLIKLLRYSTLNHRGVRVTFHKSLNIVFRLPPQVRKTKITYMLKPEEKAKENTKEQPMTNPGYSITIKKK